MAYFFVHPFGTNGTLTSVPTNGLSSGPMSYEYGFTPNYELDLTTNPSAIPISRPQTNQLYNDITTAIQQYQTHGVPDWITSTDNLGTPYAYDIYARVRYNAGSGFQVYENQVAANTATPGADSTWLVISGNAIGVVAGTMIDFGGPYPPLGYINCDGSAVSRTTYSNLFNAITQVQNGTMTVSLFTISGLTDTSKMYVGQSIEGTAIQAGTTVASIVDSTTITMSNFALASVTVPVTFFTHGSGDGSTTFNVPDSRRYTTMGSGGAGTAVIGNVSGQKGGVEARSQLINEMPAHTHTPLAIGFSFFAVGPGGAQAVTVGVGTNTFDQSGTTAITGSGDPMTLMQPSLVVTKCIKY